MAHGSSLTGLKAHAGTGDNRRPAEVGRRARLELRFVEQRGRTVLADAYAEPPFRIGRTFQEGDGVHMIMASSAPGVFGGDCLEQVIHLEEGATVRLTSQSAMQVHGTSSHGPHARSHGPLAFSDGAVATLRSRYVVANGATLTCLWDPMIPFPASQLDQRYDVHVEDGGRLIWSDAFMAGREARGERWQFASLAHELRVSRGSTLAYLERFRVAPSERGISHPWIASDACYFGTTLVSHAGADASVAERLHADLAQVPGVHAAADLLDAGFLLVRLMGSSGVPFHAARKVVAQGALSLKP
jgi:urease accessory protein